jgi:hypothetical protein
VCDCRKKKRGNWKKFDYTLARMKCNYELKDKIVQKARSLKSITPSAAFKSIMSLSLLAHFPLAVKRSEREKKINVCLRMMMMKEQGVLLVALGAIWHSSISLSLSFGFYDWRAQKNVHCFYRSITRHQ